MVALAISFPNCDHNMAAGAKIQKPYASARATPAEEKNKLVFYFFLRFYCVFLNKKLFTKFKKTNNSCMTRKNRLIIKNNGEF